MQEDSRKVFERHIEDAINYYPNLEIKAQGNNKYLKGVLDINGLGSYLIEIRHKEGYPKRYPSLFEVGGEIPNVPDYHRYSDNSCCLTVDADEILKCINGITVLDFIGDVAIPYFANQLYKKEMGVFLNEYPHGIDGIKKYYYNMLKTTNNKNIVNIYNYAFGVRKIDVQRNQLCFCNSGIKYKNCHLKIIEVLKRIGKEQITKDLKLIL